MAIEIEELQNLYQQVKEQALRDYFTFLRFQSISTDPSYAEQTNACAGWLANYLKGIGFEVQSWSTSGYPTIFASYTKAGPDQPTLLIYNHYDVQPIDPLEDWKSPPFDPTVTHGEVYARGAQDNKGQCFYTIQALKALIQRDKGLPINVKLCIEGEEECGSVGISGILNSKKKELKADYLAIVDVGIPDKNIPAVTIGVRGLVTMEVEVQGSKVDMHSGSHGGILYNPLHALVELLASLRDSTGKVTVPGFYETALPLTDKERASMEWDFDENRYRQLFGAEATGGEQQFHPQERNWFRPTLEINGICGGYTGVGFKTVIPAMAHAKISCRLVPNQDPLKIGNLVVNFLQKHAPKGMLVKAKVNAGGGKAVRANPHSKIVQAFSQAYEEVFHKPCRQILEGASIPIVTELAEASQSEVVLVGLGLPDDLIHAPNEHFGLDRFERGFLIIARTINLLRKNK